MAKKVKIDWKRAYEELAQQAHRQGVRIPKRPILRPLVRPVWDRPVNPEPPRYPRPQGFRRPEPPPRPYVPPPIQRVVERYVPPPPPRPNPVREAVQEVANVIFRRPGHSQDAVEAICGKSGQGLRGLRPDSILIRGRRPLRIKTAIRWGYVGDLPQHEVELNVPAAIALTSNKARFRKMCAEKEIAPKTWDNMDQVVYPAVVRPQHHEQGRSVYKVNNRAELEGALRACGVGAYVSAFIDKVKEFRVFVVQGRVGWVAEKIPGPNPGVSWNHAQGAHFQNMRFDLWPLKACRYAVEAFKLSGLDFGAVDVIQDAKGKCYVLEINTSLALESEYRATAIAKCFDYIVRNGKGLIPLSEAKGDWKKFVHPAVAERAIVAAAA